MYDPSIARWNGVDALAESYQNYSPYNYVLGNPIQLVDPDGLSVQGDSVFKPAPEGGVEIDPLDPVVITPNDNSDSNSESTTYGNYNALVFQSKRAYPSGSGSATPSHRDFDAFNREMSNLPYGLGFGYSLTIGALIDASIIGPAEIATGDNLGSGGLKIASIIPIGKGLSIVRMGSKLVMKSEKFAVKALTTSDGFLLKGLNIKSPFNIPAQRFGNMNLYRPDFWGTRVGSSKFVNRTFVAIKPSWNPLTTYTTGVIPKGTQVKIGLVGPQGFRYPGGSVQIIVNSKEVINQSTRIIQR